MSADGWKCRRLVRRARREAVIARREREAVRMGAVRGGGRLSRGGAFGHHRACWACHPEKRPRVATMQERRSFLDSEPDLN